MSNHVQLLNDFEKLDLLRINDYFPNYQEVVIREANPLTETLLKLTNREIAFRSKRKVERAIEYDAPIQILISMFSLVSIDRKFWIYNIGLFLKELITFYLSETLA